MKTSPLKAILLLAVVLFTAQMAQAQGTLYVSSIATMGRFGQVDVGNNAWIAEQIETGNNSTGYVLNSIQLDIGSGVLGASSFTVSIYSDVNNLPSSDLENLTGPSNPTSGIYTYSASGLALASSTEYFVVATTATPVSQSYDWVAGASSSAAGSDQWMIGGLNLVSSDQGSAWTSFNSGHDMQMAIYATPIPEPSTWVLGLLGGTLAFYVHARQRPASQAKLN